MKRLGTQNRTGLLLVGLLMGITLMLEGEQAVKAQQETPTPAHWSSPTLLSPSDDTVLGVNAITFVWSDESASGAVSYTLRINSAPYTVTTPYSFTVLPDGVYTWTVRTLDNLGDSSLYSEGWNLTIDSTASSQLSSELGSSSIVGQGVSDVMAAVVGGIIGLWIMLQIIGRWRSDSGWPESVWSWLMQLRPAMADETNVWRRVLAISFSILAAVTVVTGIFLLTRGLMRLAYVEIWTGFNDYVNSEGQVERGKTLWDWMQLLIIPIILGGGGYWFREQEQKSKQELEGQRAQAERDRQENLTRDQHNLIRHQLDLAETHSYEATLQMYLDRMTELILKDQLRTSQSDDVKYIAKARTLTVLRSLDGKYKGILIQFLYKANLIQNPSIVGLEDADLRGAQLSWTDLTEANLSKVDLTEANLINANLTKANLRKAILTQADLRGADLTDADLTDAELTEARLTDATVSDDQLIQASYSYIFRA